MFLPLFDLHSDYSIFYKMAIIINWRVLKIYLLLDLQEVENLDLYFDS